MAAVSVPKKLLQHHHRQATCCTTVTPHTQQAPRLRKALLAAHMLQGAAFVTAASSAPTHTTATAQPGTASWLALIFALVVVYVLRHLPHLQPAHSMFAPLSVMHDTLLIWRSPHTCHHTHPLQAPPLVKPHVAPEPPPFDSCWTEVAGFQTNSTNCCCHLARNLYVQHAAQRTCRMLSSATLATTQSSLLFQLKSEILLVCPPWMNSSSGGPSSASSGVCAHHAAQWDSSQYSATDGVTTKGRETLDNTLNASFTFRPERRSDSIKWA